MKKRKDIKNLICISVSAATVLSLGVLSMADELPEEEQNEEAEIAVAEDNEDALVEEGDDEIIEEISDEEAVIISDDTEIIEEDMDEQADEVIVINEDAEEVSATTGFKVSGGKIYFYDQNGKMLKGWQMIDEAWWYFKSNGEAANGWQEIGGKWYYFTSGYDTASSYHYSYYATGVRLIDDDFYCFGDDGAMVKNQWISYVGYGYFYADKNGKAVTGWKEIGGKWYHFREANITVYDGGYSYDYPYMDTGFVRIGKNYYYFNDNGVMQTSCWYEEKDYWDEDYSYWYYIGSNGKAVTGWQKIDGKYYYFEPIYKEEYDSGYVYYSKPYMVKSETRMIDGKTYYFNDKGVMQTGWVNTGSDEYPYWYYFGSDGAAYTGWHKIGGNYYCFSEYGNMYRDGLRQIDDIYYYFDENGVMQTGWIQPYAGKSYSLSQQNYWYYFDENGMAVIGWEMIGGKWYYFGEGSNSSSSSYYPYMRTSTVISQANKNGGYDYFVVNEKGIAQGGWVQVGNNWYYCDKDGKAYKGWHNIGGTYYYFSESYSPYMYKGLQTIDGKDYLFLNNGKMVTGWGEYRGKTYYADENGVLVKGDWVKSGGKWYYLDDYGVMVTGLYSIYNPKTGNYKLYRFDSTGACKNP